MILKHGWRNRRMPKKIFRGVWNIRKKKRNGETRGYKEVENKEFTPLFARNKSEVSSKRDVMRQKRISKLSFALFKTPLNSYSPHHFPPSPSIWNQYSLFFLPRIFYHSPLFSTFRYTIETMNNIVVLIPEKHYWRPFQFPHRRKIPYISTPQMMMLYVQDFMFRINTTNDALFLVIRMRKDVSLL